MTRCHSLLLLSDWSRTGASHAVETLIGQQTDERVLMAFLKLLLSQTPLAIAPAEFARPMAGLADVGCDTPARARSLPLRPSARSPPASAMHIARA